MASVARPGNATVDVWRVRLDHCAEGDIPGYRGILAPDELARAARFVFDRDQRRFVVARAALRQVLAAYLAAAPQHLEFDYGPRGKPALRGRPGSAPLRFNAAHSEALALVGVANRHDLGIDLEYARPMPDARSIAERYFTLSERAALGAAEDGTVPYTFFTYWTRKEAVLKATGDGLSLPLDRVDVGWRCSDSPRRLVVRDLAGNQHQLSVLDLEVHDGYVAALAIGGTDTWRVRTRTWPDDLLRD
ncbi:MAG TPA: 4'-phosphopantetheinyl transferase superfamily protein [Chloroflexota bacterium]|nr:4'-phosphopantetheinyl transferase superfamily protein [Chloroflexota bacterium]